LADASDIFAVFTRVITEGMSHADLRARVLSLEGKNEVLHEALAKFEALRGDMARDLRASHDALSLARDEAQALRAQVRELQAQLARQAL
jgi:tRNA A-37 threonylcarbamoyl transferase component Bud32